jgi:hypothetical protein
MWPGQHFFKRHSLSEGKTMKKQKKVKIIAPPQNWLVLRSQVFLSNKVVKFFRAAAVAVSAVVAFAVAVGVVVVVVVTSVVVVPT